VLGQPVPDGKILNEQEAGGSFGFPETITSVSYQLRQTYQRLLWDYEQMYFWRNAGPRVLPPANPTTPRIEKLEPAEGAVQTCPKS